MNKQNVRSPGDALAYLTDCTLATVCDLAGKKRRPAYEFRRQCMIAQTAINWMVDMSVDFSGTRAADVVKAGSVEAWAAQFFPAEAK